VDAQCELPVDEHERSVEPVRRERSSGSRHVVLLATVSRRAVARERPRDVAAGVPTAR
jgi:hypothetical protein